jgi:hypothetical protein
MGPGACKGAAAVMMRAKSPGLPQKFSKDAVEPAKLALSKSGLYLKAAERTDRERIRCVLGTQEIAAEEKRIDPRGWMIVGIEHVREHNAQHRLIERYRGVDMRVGVGVER